MSHRSPFVFVLGALLVGAGFAVACASSDDGADGNGAGANNGIDPDDAGFDGNTTPTCVLATGTDETAALVKLDDPTGTSTATLTGDGCARSFSIASTAERRDNLPASPRLVTEEEGRPSLQTKNAMFDALYQLALDEAKENSVASIKDGAFKNGQEIACAEGGCFETGRKWTYVWTRDTSYAVNLGLGWVDPPRARNSLDFKLSTRRGGDGLEIVQDTGSGGSYPVSTDRVVWALGAREAIRHLSGEAQTAFRDRALTAIKNTASHDRAVVFDPTDGLYRGEQSFLDWREQTYPAWTVPDLSHIASSKSLSTNVLHLILLEEGASLARQAGDAATAGDLASKADALRTAIRAHLWLAEDKQLSTYVTTTLDPAPARRFDLLGTSLAVLEGVISGEEAKAAIASYPTLPAGPPVIFPQQKETPIYHNRAIWPFVTAYWARAARKVGNDGAFDAALRSLVRGAALNLSNMENLELASGKPWFDDGAYSGPVVSSQRQLWSVAGYLSLVNQSLFGVETTAEGLRIQPFVTRGIRSTLFASASSLALNNLPWHGKKITVVIKLPPKTDGAGVYPIKSVRLNGQRTDNGLITDDKLSDRNLVEAELEDAPLPPEPVRVINDTSNYRTIYGPRPPQVLGVGVSGGKIQIGIGITGESPSDVTINVYRDGARVATDLPGSTTSWTDATSNGDSSPSYCYTVETRYVTSGNVSQRANPACFWGPGASRVLSIYANNFNAAGGNLTTSYGRTFYESWGDAGSELSATFTASRSGAHLLQAVYGNGAGSINTGITCAVKHVVVEENGGGVAGEGYLVMPQRGDWASWGDSTFVRVTLSAGKTYRVRVLSDERSINMSAFEHFTAYTGGLGGSSGAFQRVNIAELKVLATTP